MAKNFKSEYPEEEEIISSKTPKKDRYHLYPTDKPGHSSQERRYHKTVKKSDSDKAHGKNTDYKQNKMNKDS